MTAPTRLAASADAPRRRARVLARMAASVLAAAALLLAGCGDRAEDPAPPASTPADRERATAFSRGADDYTRWFARFIAAAGEERLPAARRALGEVRAALAATRATGEDFDSADLRRRATRFLETYADLVAASNRWLTYYETPGPEDAAAEAELQAELERATRAMEREGRGFLDPLMKPADSGAGR